MRNGVHHEGKHENKIKHSTRWIRYALELFLAFTLFSFLSFLLLCPVVTGSGAF